MLDLIKENTGIILIIFMSIFGLMIVFSLSRFIKEAVEYNKKTKKIIKGISDIEKVNDSKKVAENIKKRRKKKNFLLKLYQENIFFGGKKFAFFRNLFLGYLIFTLLLYIVSKSIPLSLIFGLSWFVLFYVLIDKKNEKNRKKYIKGFTLSLKTLTATVEAGNSFEEGVALIVKRDSINAKIRQEFALLSNHLKSGKSLDEALDSFWKRNSMFQEFSMFVIVMQFYSKKGGAGLGKILLQLEETLSKKVENYSEIDTELGIHKVLMNFCIYAYFVILLGVKLFKPTFYVELANDSLGIVKAFASILLIIAATVFFKSMVRNAAEG